MSRRKFASDLFASDAKGTSSNSGAPLGIDVLKKFAAPKKRCLMSDKVDGTETTRVATSHINSRNHIVEPLETNPSVWQQFYSVECHLNEDLQKLVIPTNISHIYNPIDYAASLHCAYLQKFLDGPKPVVFIGMNPGPNGMGQTGVPFGNIQTVRNEMCLKGTVRQPPVLHAKRPVLGLECTTEEPSGVRIWGLFKKLAGGSLTTFSQQCFVHNFCPLTFYDKAGKNITPSELKGDYKANVGKLCLDALDKELDLLKPEILIAVGEYMNGMLKSSQHAKSVKILKLPHPSPRSLNNQNWPEKAEKLLHELDLVKYIRNEV